MIRFENVHKTYKTGTDALRGVTFAIRDGEFVFVIGKSGSGKSTLMKCITREEKPTEGLVIIDKFCISKMSRALVPTLRRQIGIIYQDFRLIESKTVEENIAFSGGEQQRVAIARAMLNNPKLIVADEPTGNLDPETSESIMALLEEINRQGTTVIVCTHDSNLVDRMKKRVIEVDEGLIVRDEFGSGYTAEDKTALPKSMLDEFVPEVVTLSELQAGSEPLPAFPTEDKEEALPEFPSEDKTEPEKEVKTDKKPEAKIAKVEKTEKKIEAKVEEKPEVPVEKIEEKKEEPLPQFPSEENKEPLITVVDDKKPDKKDEKKEKKEEKKDGKKAEKKEKKETKKVEEDFDDPDIPSDGKEEGK